jgi:hypothetical protein
VGAPCRTALRTLRVLALCFLSYCLHCDLCKYKEYKHYTCECEGRVRCREGEGKGGRWREGVDEVEVRQRGKWRKGVGETEGRGGKVAGGGKMRRCTKSIFSKSKTKRKDSEWREEGKLF